MPVDLLTRRSRWHVLPIEIQRRTFFDFSPVIKQFLDALPLRLMWWRIRTSQAGPLWGLAAFGKNTDFFYNDCCEPKHKFSRGKAICITGSSSPWGGGESWCLVASAVFLPAGVKWVAKLELREEKQKGEKGSEEQPCSVYMHGNLHPDRSQILSRHYHSPQIMPLPVRTRPADLQGRLLRTWSSLRTSTADGW